MEILLELNSVLGQEIFKFDETIPWENKFRTKLTMIDTNCWLGPGTTVEIAKEASANRAIKYLKRQIDSQKTSLSKNLIVNSTIR